MAELTVWDRIVGQDRVVQQLRRAAERPVHAYLFVGARGSGVDDAARCFATALVAGESDARATDLVRRGMHPDVVEFEPEGGNYRVKEDVRQRIIPEASRSPIESDRKVLVLYDADRLRGNQGESANALLKTIEEPPARTVILLVTSLPDELPITVRSRCQRVDLAPLSEAVVRANLEASGVNSTDAELAARLAGGQPARARALVAGGVDRAIRDAFVAAALALDGRAGAALRHADALTEAVKAAVAGVEAGQREEAEALADEVARAGYPDRAAAALTTRLADRQKREHRAARRQALREGIAAIESLYRDVLAGADAPQRNLDRSPVALAAPDAARGLDACREAREALERNPNEALLLERLLLALPAATG